MPNPFVPFVPFDPDRPPDLTVYEDGKLIGVLDQLRSRLAVEPHDDVRAFYALNIDAVVAEMRRRTAARVRLMAEARLS